MRDNHAALPREYIVLLDQWRRANGLKTKDDAVMYQKAALTAALKAGVVRGATVEETFAVALFVAKMTEVRCDGLEKLIVGIRDDAVRQETVERFRLGLEAAASWLSATSETYNTRDAARERIKELRRVVIMRADSH